MCADEAVERPVVVGIGEILWDMLPSGKQLGGAPTNFAYHAQALGAEGIVASAVGEDELGREILGRLDDLKMSRQYVAADPAHPTGTVEVRVDGQGVPTFIIHQDVAWDNIRESPELMELAGRASAVCYGSLAQRSAVSRETIRKFLAACGGPCLRIFDINLRQNWYDRQTVHDSLVLADVLKLNDQELPVLAKLLEVDSSEEEATISELVMRYPLRLIALTRGSAGSRLYYPSGRLYEHPGYPAEVADTVGAGDAFTAALTMGLLEGRQPEEIHDRANRLASFVCSQAGATPQIPADLWERKLEDEE